MPWFVDFPQPPLICLLDEHENSFDYHPTHRLRYAVSMNRRLLCSRIFKVVGCVAAVLGSLDPLEGSVLILPGIGLVALSMYLSGRDHRTVAYWGWTFALVVVGVAAMFGLSSVGGIGGRSGHSMWWGLLILPYPAGWLMALAGGIVGLARFFKARGQQMHA